jgi:hypothetical protein
MVRYSFLVRLFHPLLHAGLSRRILDHLVRPHQHIRRNRKADLLGCFQINHQLKLRRLLDREISGFRPFDNFVNVQSHTLKESERFGPYVINPPASANSLHPARLAKRWFATNSATSFQ